MNKPVITSEPVTEAYVNVPYTYQVIAIPGKNKPKHNVKIKKLKIKIVSKE